MRLANPPPSPGVARYEFRFAVEAEQLAKIGITVRAKVTRYPAEWVTAFREGRFTLSDGPVPDVFYELSALFAIWTTGAVNNRSGLSDPQVDEFYKKQGVIVDPVERKKTVDQLHQRLREMVPAIPAYHPMHRHAARPEVRGWTHLGILRDNFGCEKVWIAQ